MLDLTQTAKTFDDVCGWVTRAIARELTDETRLHAAMKARQRLRWRADLQELVGAAAAGDHSVLEFRYHRDVERAHGLPESARQVPFTKPGGRRGRRDRVYEPFRVAIELDGRLAHQPKTSGGMRPGTTPPPRTGSSPCGTAGRRLSGSPVRPRPRWRGCFAAVVGAACPGRARPAARSGGTCPGNTARSCCGPEQHSRGHRQHSSHTQNCRPHPTAELALAERLPHEPRRSRQVRHHRLAFGRVGLLQDHAEKNSILSLGTSWRTVGPGAPTPPR